MSADASTRALDRATELHPEQADVPTPADLALADVLDRVLYRTAATMDDVPGDYRAVALGALTDAGPDGDATPAVVHPFDLDQGRVFWVYASPEDFSRVRDAAPSAAWWFVRLAADVATAGAAPWRCCAVAPATGELLRQLDPTEGVER